MRRLIRPSTLLFSAFYLLTWGIPLAWGGGPFIITKTGVAYVWDNTSAIPYNPDLGTLGMKTNAEAVAIVAEAFGAWATTAIPTADLSFTNGGPLSMDVNTVAEYDSVTGSCGGPTNPIIFDADGSLTTALGLPSGVIGFAGIVCVTTVAPFEITKGVAVLNGKFIDGNNANGEVSEDDFKATFKHEFGHLLNLDHAQVNGHYFLGDTDDPGFSEYGAPPVASIELMFPFLIPGGATDPISDDIAAISTLYPSASFSTKGAITGSIFRSDGATLFQGADVIARNVADPFFDAVSNISGARYCQPGRDTCVSVTGTAPAQLKGFYELTGLTSGDSYTVEMVNINPSFTDGSAAGPFTTPVAIPGPEEFYNGVSEAAGDPPDDPTAFTAIAVASTVTDIDITLNGPFASVTPSSHDFGSVLVGDSADFGFTLENTGGETLSGTATTSAPFSIVSGGSYNLSPGGSQMVTVRFSPVTPGTFNKTVSFSGGDGDSASVTGTAPNQPPVLDPVGDQTLSAGSTLDVSLSATDPDGGQLSFSITNAPVFATLMDNGNGTATLHLAPTTGDAGTYNNVVITVSDGGSSDSEAITIVVTSSSGGGGGGGGGGCFIATAAYGSPLEPHVQLLRTFRDRVLLALPGGDAVVTFYYSVSPPVAEVIAESELLKLLLRLGLLPVIGLAWLTVAATLYQQGLILSGMGVIYLAYRSRCNDRNQRDETRVL